MSHTKLKRYVVVLKNRVAGLNHISFRVILIGLISIFLTIFFFDKWSFIFHCNHPIARYNWPNGSPTSLTCLKNSFVEVFKVSLVCKPNEIVESPICVMVVEHFSSIIRYSRTLSSFCLSLSSWCRSHLVIHWKWQLLPFRMIEHPSHSQHFIKYITLEGFWDVYCILQSTICQYENLDFYYVIFLVFRNHRSDIS